MYKEGVILDTPELKVNTEVILRPISRRILPEVMESYQEDPDAAKAALPWLDWSFEIVRSEFFN